MNQAKILIASTAAAAASLGFSLQHHPAPFWETNIVIAGDESVPKGNVQSDEDSSAAQSAKMGKDEGTQTGGANQGTPPENDTQKIDQPPRQNPTTGQQ
jgi:predicted NUDIX family NTP pyrophosphohydrolase